MKILSIDVGIYNLAICILNVNEKIEIEYWSDLNILKGKEYCSTPKCKRVATHIHEDKYYCIDYSRENFAELVELLGSVEKVYDLYYKTLKKAINSDLGVYKPKRIGHINLVRKYNKIFPYDYSKNEILEDIVKLIKDKNYEVDYNISGLYKEDCGEEYISGYLYDLIKKYHVPMVFGSDSHSCETLGEYSLPTL